MLTPAPPSRTRRIARRILYALAGLFALVALLSYEWESPPEHRTAHTLAEYYSDLPVPTDAKVLTFVDTFVDSTGRNLGLGSMAIVLQLSDSQFVRVWSAAKRRNFRPIPGSDSSESTEAFARFVRPDAHGLFRIVPKTPRLNSYQLVIVDSARKTLVVRVEGDSF